MPFHVEPQDRVKKWAETSLAVFNSLIPERAGVTIKAHTEAFSKQIPMPWWMEMLEEIARPAFIPEHYPFSYTIKMPFIDTSIYMPYLMKQFKQLGGKIIKQEIISLKSFATKKMGIIVNCTGMGASKLSNDPCLFPISGQIIRVEKPVGLIDASFLHIGEKEVILIAPRTNDCIIGATANENDPCIKPNLETAKKMLANAIKIYPHLATAKVIEHKVGLRPGRNKVRLEYEDMGDACLLIHNYGHGGAGITLAPGCAQEVLQIVLNHLYH